MVEAKELICKQDKDFSDSSFVVPSNSSFKGSFVKDSFDLHTAIPQAELEGTSARVEVVTSMAEDRERRYRRKKRRFKKLVGIGGPSCPSLPWPNKKREVSPRKKKNSVYSQSISG